MNENRQRYDNGQDWVEIDPVVARRPMRELIVLDGNTLGPAHEYAASVTLDAHFTDADGKVVDWKTDVLGLTVQQWNWWKARVWAAARDAKADPEA
jgi:hypothetical protein